MPDSNSNSAARIEQFWVRYIDVLKRFRVPERALPWYRRHVQAFIDANSERRLRDQTPQTLVGWLEETGRRPDLADWQFRQMVDALRLLFSHLMKLDWAAELDWNHWLEGSRTLSREHPSVARSYEIAAKAAENPRNLLARQHPECFRKFLAAIRLAGLASNTERSYLGWTNRFLYFHENQSLDGCSEPEVASFLEHLAVKRKVAGATQSQALNALVFFFAKVLERPLGRIGNYATPKRPKRVPTVLSRTEVTQVLGRIDGQSGLTKPGSEKNSFLY